MEAQQILQRLPRGLDDEAMHKERKFCELVPVEEVENAFPLSRYAKAAAVSAAATVSAKDRRLRLRVSAVLASRERRYRDALQYALDAYEVAQRLGHIVSESGLAAEIEQADAASFDTEGPALVELLLIVRSALAIGDFGTGLGFLEVLAAHTNRLTGIGGTPSLLMPAEASTLLYCISELCALYGDHERAEDYSHTYLGVARVAHGEDSQELGDAHGFVCSLLARGGRYEEAVLHAHSMLKIRQRHAGRGAEKPVANAYWNMAVLQYQMGQHREALDSLEAGREVHVRVDGEGVSTAKIDLALAQIWTTLGEPTRAARELRQAVRLRQRALGFAHPETRRAAALLAAAEVQCQANDEWKSEQPGEVSVKARQRTKSLCTEGESDWTPGGRRFIAKAEESDRPLGFAPFNVPPGRIFVQTVETESWADKAGIKVNDEIILLNGEEVEPMDAERFKEQLRSRPLRLEVSSEHIKTTGNQPARLDPGRRMSRGGGAVGRGGGVSPPAPITGAAPLASAGTRRLSRGGGAVGRK